MKNVLATEDIAVLDDFLPVEEFRAMGQFAQRGPYEFVENRNWAGAPLSGPVYVSEPVPEVKGVTLFPSHEAIDLVFTRVNESLSEFRHWVGEKGSDWDCFSAQCFCFGPGAGVAWHDHAELRKGSFTLYLHPQWEEEWGGELCVRRSPRPDHLISPQPNRLVILSPRVMHRVNQVESRSGGRGRYSVTGFFFTRRRALDFAFAAANVKRGGE